MPSGPNRRECWEAKAITKQREKEKGDLRPNAAGQHAKQETHEANSAHKHAPRQGGIRRWLTKRVGREVQERLAQQRTKTRFEVILQLFRELGRANSKTARLKPGQGPQCQCRRKISRIDGLSPNGTARSTQYKKQGQRPKGSGLEKWRGRDR